MTPAPKPTPTAPEPMRLPSGKRWPVALLALSLAACGGGGGGDSTTSPTPAPVPAPGPAPVPPPGPAPAPAPSTAPSITTQPADLGVIAPAAASFTVVVAGSPAPTVQWQKSTGTGAAFVNIAGATSATLTLASTAVADNASMYQAVVGNLAGTTTSRAASLTVTAAAVAPAITSQPSAVTVTAPASATFTVSATGSPTVTYQWQLSSDSGVNFSNIAGATGATYNTPTTAVANSGQVYRVVVSNGQTTVNSTAVALTVNPAASVVGSASTCTAASSYAAGFTYNVVYDSPASSGSFTTTIAGRVNGPGTFHGQAATEIEEVTTITAPNNGGTVLNSDTKIYATFAASTAQLTRYGSSASLTDFGGQTTLVDNVYSPASLDGRFALSAGGSTTVRTQQTVTRNGTAQPSTDETTTVVFGGFETLTVPAGTYQACKFTDTTSNNVQTVSWLLVGNGVLLKSASGSAVSQARSVLINGIAR